MKHLSNKSVGSIIWTLVLVFVAYIVIEKVFKSEPVIRTVTINKTIKIPVLDTTLMIQKTDSVNRVARADFEKELAYELSQMKPGIKEIFLETVKYDENKWDTLKIIYSESILFDTLMIDGNEIFNKYLVGAKTINYPPLDLKLKRFENNFVYTETIPVLLYESRFKKIGDGVVKGLAIIGVIKLLEIIK